MSNLDILRNLDVSELADNPKSDAYWDKEEKWLSKRIEENEKFAKSIQMSDTKFKQRFTI